MFPSFSQDEIPTIDILNAIQVDAAAVGNHEFDRGFDDLVNRVDPASKFTHLGANVYLKGTTTPALPEYELFTRDGVTVAVIGVAPRTTGSSVNPDGVSTIEFGDPVDAMNRVARQLSDGDPNNGEADVIIASYHEGAPVDGSATLQQAKDSAVLFQRIVDETDASVDVIFNGHTHRLYHYDAPVPGADGRTRPVLQAGYYASHIGKVELTITDGEVTAHVAENIETYASADAVPTAVQGSAPYVACAEAVEEALSVAEETAGEPIGFTTDPLTRASLTPDTVTEDRASESTMANFIADMLRDRLAPEHLGGAMIGLQNPGGTRADWDQGVLTYGEAAAVLPFANTLVTTTLTGAQFKQVLEEQWQPDGASRPFLHLALSDNVQFTYDAERARNDRITSVIVDGEPLDPEAEYVIGTMSFLAAGGDRLFTLAEGTDVVDLGLLDMQELVEYVKAQSDPSGAPAISPDYRKRAVEVFEVGADKSAPVAPTTVTRCEVGPSLQVNQLDFSSIPSVANEELVATIDGFEIGRATVIDGSATIELDGTELTAEHTGTVLTLTAQPTGTVVQVPVTITGDACPTGGPGAPGDDEPGDDDPRDDDAERTDPPARPRGLPDTGR
ncbi:MAG: bifunctional metallophosphatase/5'-nucleotidase [Propionibacterium sp.]|nr:bifunctional metallophosphatase/5'-nucleotidase [Propionibacterium sp.]